MSSPKLDDSAAPNLKPGKWSWRNFKGRFLFISIALHVILGLVATYLVITTIQARKPPNFKAGPPAAAPSRSDSVKVKAVQKQRSMSAPAPTKRITSTAVARVALPEMPDMPSPSSAAPTTMGGMGGTGVSFGGMGTPGGSGGGGGMTLFGIREAGKGIPGTFYDFKQTKAGTATDMVIAGEYNTPKDNQANGIYSGLVAKFIDRGMGEGVLGRYFTGPSPLYAAQIYIPGIDATEAPKAFGLEGKAQPRRWIIVYKGTVMAPQGGKYKLVGGADDIIAVRFNGKIVINNRGKRDGFYAYGGTYQGGGIISSTLDVKASIPYPIDIVIGEQPGGAFLAYLLIEKEGEQYRKNDQGSPILPIFKMAPSPAPERGRGVPEFAPDTAWSVWKSTPRER